MHNNLLLWPRKKEHMDKMRVLANVVELKTFLSRM